MTKQLRELIKEFLTQVKTLNIATSYEKKPWIATVFYAFDNDFNFYFLSDPNTRHGKEIAENKNVAGTIYRDQQDYAPVCGVQFEGSSEIVSVGELPKVFVLIAKRFKNFTNIAESADVLLSKAFGAKIYKITPSTLYFLDEETFGEGVRKELKLSP